MSASLPPLSLYLHLPWCVQKCPYCDFNSHRAGDNAPFGQYVAALKKDIDVESERAAGRGISSIFLGGGTPSLFSPADVEDILTHAARALNIANDCEVTLEANPGTVELDDPGGFRSAGVNRLSLGAQTFDAELLKKLGRIHGPDDIRAAFGAARGAGFDNINVDLMFALPSQDLEKATTDLEALIELGPEHVSYYQLTLEPNTVFYQQPPNDLPDEDTVWEMQETGATRLAQAGYQQYEVSAFARPGMSCRHNLNYWQFGDYLAAGAGAHGKVTDAEGIVSRYRKPLHPQAYMDAMASGTRTGVDTVSAGDLSFEFMLNALRLTEGFSESLFTGRTRLPGSAVGDVLATAREEGLLDQPMPGSWRPTPRGRRFLNDLQARFLP